MSVPSSREDRIQAAISLIEVFDASVEEAAETYAVPVQAIIDQMRKDQPDA